MNYAVYPETQQQIRLHQFRGGVQDPEIALAFKKKKEEIPKENEEY